MRSHLLALSAFLLLALGQATSAELTWTGGGGAGMTDWSSPLNWGGATPADGDALIFPNVVNKNASNGSYPANTAFGPLTFNAGGYVLSGASVITLEGGIFLNGANTAQVVMPIELESPVAFTVSHGSGILTLTQAISGAGGIIKSGNGLMILNGNHNYTGPTIINGGTLQIGGNLPSNVQISAGGLIGIGTIDGITSLNQGVVDVSPGIGSTPGTLTCDGDLNLYSNDRLFFTIGATSDKLVVNGVINLGLAGIYPEVLTAPALNTDVTLIDNLGTDAVIYDEATPSNYLYTFASLPGYCLILVGGPARNDVVLRRVPTTTTTVSLTSSNLSVTHGTSVTFTATVTGAVAGATVSFWDGNRYLGEDVIASGQAQFSTSAIEPGTRKITAFFQGNGTYAPARSPIINQTILGTVTTTTLVVSPSSPTAANTLLTLTATVNTNPPGGFPAGSVTFYDTGTVLGTVTVAANQAVYTTSALIAGSHTLGAIFTPANPPTNAAYGSFSPGVPHTVTGTVTSTALTTSGTPGVAGTDITFTATVTGGTPTGSVLFRDGAVTLGTVAVTGGGPATAALTTSGLSAGTHSITAYYLGSTEEQASTSNVVSQVITAAPDGSGTTDPNVELSGGCGLGSGISALLLGLLMMLGLRLRRN